jgi:hypothetical protein
MISKLRHLSAPSSLIVSFLGGETTLIADWVSLGSETLGIALANKLSSSF